MHHFPVKGAGLANDDEIRVNVGDGEAGLIQFVDERAFANHIGFFTFLATQEIGGGHGGGVERGIRHFDTCGGEAVGQVLSGLRRIVGQHHQRHAFFQDAFDKFSGAGNSHVIVHQHAVDITNYVLNGHGQSNIINERRNYKAGLTFQQML